MSYSRYEDERPFSTLLGLTLASIDTQDDEIIFTTTDGRVFQMDHAQDCCETVEIESIVGDLNDLIGSPILKAEESTSDTRPESVPAEEYEPESQTWTFYKLATIKGYVDIRWYGASNGYYSESVDFYEVPSTTQGTTP
mgnify:CR=1 FL=1